MKCVRTQRILTPNIDKALACAYKQCQHKSCVNKQTELVQIPPPPPGFLLPSGSCRCCVTYRNTNSECAPPIQDELDINGIIKEFKAATRIHEEYEYGFFNGSAVIIIAHYQHYCETSKVAVNVILGNILGSS